MAQVWYFLAIAVAVCGPFDPAHKNATAPQLIFVYVCADIYTFLLTPYPEIIQNKNVGTGICEEGGSCGCSRQRQTWFLFYLLLAFAHWLIHDSLKSSAAAVCSSALAAAVTVPVDCNNRSEQETGGQRERTQIWGDSNPRESCEIARICIFFAECASFERGMYYNYIMIL
jgi:hypothetical protein